MDGGDGSIRPPQTQKFLALLRAFTGGRSFSKNNVDIGALAGSGQLCSRAAIGGNLQEPHAAENAEYLSRRAFRVGIVHLCNLPAADEDLEFLGGVAEKHRSVLRSDVGDQISETINLEYDSAQFVLVYRFWLGGVETYVVFNLIAEFQGINFLGEIRRDRRENVARMECIADRLQKIMLRSNVAHMHALFAGVNQGQYTVIGSNKVVFIAGGQNRPARRAHARIDHNHVHGPVGKVCVSLRDRQGAIQHIEGLYAMADVDDLRVRHYVENNALHRADEMVISAEVGGKSNNWTIAQISPTDRYTNPKSSTLIARYRRVKARR